MTSNKTRKALLRKTWFAAIVTVVLGVAAIIGFYQGWSQVKQPTMVALAFHGVTDRPSMPWEITPDELDTFIRQFKRHEYQPIDPASFSNLLNTGFTGRHFLLTFDDGLLSSADAIKKLYTDYGIKSVLFVITDLIDKPGYMGKPMLLDLQNNFGCHIGLHGKRHYEVTKILAEGGNLTAELEQARVDLSALTENTIDWYAYPFGDFNASATNCIASTGIKLAFSISGSDISTQTNSLMIPRVMYLKGAKVAGEGDPSDWLPPKSASTGALTITLSLLVGFFGLSWSMKTVVFFRALKALTKSA